MADRGVIGATGAVLEQTSIEKFRGSLRGEVLRPRDDGYDTARKVWNAMIDKRPR